MEEQQFRDLYAGRAPALRRTAYLLCGDWHVAEDLVQSGLVIVHVRTVAYDRLMALIMTISDARATLPHLIDRVEAGEEVTLTRHGKPVAVVVRPDALRVRRADAAVAEAERLRSRLVQARDVPLSEVPSLHRGRAEELVAAVRAGRNRG